MRIVTQVFDDEMLKMLGVSGCKLRPWERKLGASVYENTIVDVSASDHLENKYLQFAIWIPLQILRLLLFPLRPIKQTLFEGLRVEDFPRTAESFSVSAIASHPLIEAAMEMEARLRAWNRPECTERESDVWLKWMLKRILHASSPNWP